MNNTAKAPKINNLNNSNKCSETNDVVIIGAGITGTALFYTLSNYSNLKKITLLEKYSNIASLNSSSSNNSQTLHFGDIESNYTYEKAQKVSQNAELVAGFLEKNAQENDVYYKKHKILLAVGKEQKDKIFRRFQEIKTLFPKIKLLTKKEILELEPLINKKRNQDSVLAAIYSPDGYAIDYGKLSKLFLKLSTNKTKQKNLTKKKLTIQLNTIVKKIDYDAAKECYKLTLRVKNSIDTSTETYIHSKVLLVAAGAHSLILAKRLGIGKNLGILPVSGSFFRTNRKLLNGKVYTLQQKKLPFAAIHGDPHVNNPNETRFGPTARVLPILEKYNWKTVPDFLRTSAFTISGILSLFKIISDKTIFLYTIRNMFYDLPIIGKRLFLKEIKKIVPSISLDDLDYSRGIGGIRPQIVDTDTKKLVMGQGKLYGANAIFNITPSPGASNCLANAKEDAIKLRSYFGPSYHFDQKKFQIDHKR